MIKTKMLNEMNPKLRALLAAGLIGTASLGAASCSMPTDDPTIYEQPAPETPSNPSDTEEAVTFESLGVADYAESLARAEKDINNGEALVYNEIPIIDTDFIYIDEQFVNASTMDIEDDSNVDASELGNITYICYTDSDTCYYVPKSMESKFDQAIATYKAAHAE